MQEFGLHFNLAPRFFPNRVIFCAIACKCVRQALDLRVYNMAALAILNVDLDQLVGFIEKSAGEGKTLTHDPGLPRRRVISRGIE